MRIAYISYEYPPDTAFGGIATYVQMVAELMVSRGHDVEVFTGSLNRQGSFSESGIKIYRIKEENRIRFAKSILPVFTEQHQKKPFDVIEAPEFCADARYITDTFSEIPYLLRMHTPSKMSAELNSSTGEKNTIKKRFLLFGTNLFTSNPIGRLKKILKRKLYIYNQEKTERKEAQKADFVAAPSLDLCKFVEQKWGIDPENIFHSPHPFLPDFRFLDLPVTNRKKNDSVNIGFIGRVQRRKGISELISIIPDILNSFKNVTFTFVGNVMNEPVSGLPYSEWATKVLGEHITKVHFTGNVPYGEIPAFFSRMDIVVLPSIWENFPNTCLEAMSAGRAIIGSKHGGMAEMLNGGECGLLIDPNHPESITDAILYLIKKPKIREDFGRKARNRVLNYYNEDVIGKQLEEIFTKVIALDKIE